MQWIVLVQPIKRLIMSNANMNAIKQAISEYNDIFENINVQNWFKLLALKEPLAFSAIIGDNRKNFKRIFNTEPDKSVNQDGLEIFSWKIQEQGMVFNIIVTENKQSNIDDTDNFSSYYLVKYFGKSEDFSNDINISSYLILFLDKLLKNLSNP